MNYKLKQGRKQIKLKKKVNCFNNKFYRSASLATSGFSGAKKKYFTKRKLVKNDKVLATLRKLCIKPNLQPGFIRYLMLKNTRGPKLKRTT